MAESLQSGSAFVPQANSEPDLLVIEARFENEEGVAVTVDNDLDLKLFKPGDPVAVATFNLVTGDTRIERRQFSTGSYYFVRVNPATLGFDDRGVEARWSAKLDGKQIDPFPLIQQLNRPSTNETILLSSELKDWLRSRLGYPHVAVELTESQFGNAIDKALELYNRWVPKKKYATLQLVAGQTAYEIPEYGRGIVDVQAIRKEGIPLISDPLFGREYPRGQQIDFTQYVWGTSFFETLLRVTGQDLEWDWNMFQPKTLYVQAQAQSYLVCYCYFFDHRLEEITPSHHELFRRIVLANGKATLGEIREKIGEIPAPDGRIPLNGKELKEDAAKMMEKIMEDLQGLSPPPPPLMY